jgi:hypothetical protein
MTQDPKTCRAPSWIKTCTPRHSTRTSMISINFLTMMRTSMILALKLRMIMKMMIKSHRTINSNSQLNHSRIKMTRISISLIIRAYMQMMMRGKNTSAPKLGLILSQKIYAKEFTKSLKKESHLKWSCILNRCY